MKAFVYLCVLWAMIAGSVFAGDNGSGLTPDKALSMLSQGNDRFVTGAVQRPHQDFLTRQETAAKGQKPFAGVLSCADSRGPVEILFDTGVGDIFTVRVAGNVAGVNETASMEYAADHLHIPVLVVLGHSHCGAVTAAVEGGEAPGSIPFLLKNIVPAVETAKKEKAKAEKPKLVDEAIRVNVWNNVEALLKSPIISQKVKDKNLSVIGAYYHLDTGKVEWLGPHAHQDKILAAVGSNNGAESQSKN